MGGVAKGMESVVDMPFKLAGGLLNGLTGGGGRSGAGAQMAQRQMAEQEQALRRQQMQMQMMGMQRGMYGRGRSVKKKTLKEKKMISGEGVKDECIRKVIKKASEIGMKKKRTTRSIPKKAVPSF